MKNPVPSTMAVILSSRGARMETCSNTSIFSDLPTLSKRAARRLIQRAFVLAGRDRLVRQHIREAHLSTFWVVEDWKLEWTLIVHRGTLEFGRHPVKSPDATLSWRNAEFFFRDVQNATRASALTSAVVLGNQENSDFEFRGEVKSARLLEPVYHAFCTTMRHVLANPVDENGDPLV